MPDLHSLLPNAWSVDLRGREARSPIANVTFRWTSDGCPLVFLVRPNLPGLTECDAWHVAQAAQRAIASEVSADALRPQTAAAS
jgi:hypothetical protein